MEITEELLDSFKTDRGGYTAVTIGILSAISGSKHKHKWKKRSIGKEIGIDAIALIENDVRRRNDELALKPVKKQSTKKKKSKKIRSVPRYKGDVNSPEFLNSYEWRKLRMIVLKRDGAKCSCCGASPETGAVMNVDHIKPRKTHPNLALDPQNLQVLCHECNHGKGNWDSTSWRTKKIRD